MDPASPLVFIAFLLHFSHYDPSWFDRKAQELPFNIERGLEVVDALADQGFNTLIIDVADGVVYTSHPELKRHYSVPISSLKAVVDRARQRGLRVIPKLNFSKSARNKHNHWFAPYNEFPDNDEYFQKAFEIIDEVVRVCRPEKYFHIGMDEDTDRTDDQYVSAVKRFADGLKKRGLTAVMWNDTTHLSGPMFQCVRKALAAEDAVPKDIVQVVWDYGPVRERKAARVKNIVAKGFDVWIAPGWAPESIAGWRDAALKSGCKGLVMVMWRKIDEKNSQQFLDRIKTLGPVFSGRSALAAPPLAPEKKLGMFVSKGKAKDLKAPVLAANHLKGPLNGPVYLVQPGCYVRNWMTLGPIRFDPTRYASKEQVETLDDASFVPGRESALFPKATGDRTGTMEWKRYVPKRTDGFTNIVNLNWFYGQTDYAVAYLTANVFSPEAAKGLRMFLGSDDYIRVWINGEEVHSYNERTRNATQDDDEVDGVSLRKGWNLVAVKLVNIKGGWEFFLRFADKDGRPLVVTDIDQTYAPNAVLSPLKGGDSIKRQ